MHSVCLCARYQSQPKETHLKAVKRIIRYVKHTSDYGLFYPKLDSFDLISYCDADYDQIEKVQVELVTFWGIF